MDLRSAWTSLHMLQNPMNCSLPDSSAHGDSPGKNTGVGCHALIQGTPARCSCFPYKFTSAVALQATLPTRLFSPVTSRSPSRNWETKGQAGEAACSGSHRVPPQTTPLPLAAGMGAGPWGLPCGKYMQKQQFLPFLRKSAPIVCADADI